MLENIIEIIKRRKLRVIAVAVLIIVLVILFGGGGKDSRAKTTTDKLNSQDGKVVTVSTYGTSDVDLQLDADGAVAYMGGNGEFLYSKSPDGQFDPLSLTKVMTALMVMEAVDKGQISLDDEVEVTKEDTKCPESKLFLKAGEKIPVRSLLKAALIESMNDAAAALGSYVGGDKETFATMMNERAVELGCTHTQFKNANGLIEDGLHSTPHDMALIAKAAFKYDYVRKICKMKKAKIKGTKEHPDGWTVELTNPFFSSQYGAAPTYKKYKIQAGKTGTWDIGNAALMEMAKYKGRTFYTIVMHSPLESRYTDTVKLMDYVRAVFDEREAIAKAEAKKEKASRTDLEKSLDKSELVQSIIQYVNDKFRDACVKMVAGYKTSNGMVSLAWNERDNAEGYVIFRSTDGSKFKQIELIDDPSTTKYTDEDVKSKHVYRYFVRAYKGSTLWPVTE